MAIQDDNTILNKGDLKAYHEAIAPLLGGTFMVRTNNSDYYSTDEKVVGVWTDGKPIYQKTIDCGVGPNTTTKSVAHGISNIDKIINFSGFRYGNNLYSPIPDTNTGGSTTDYEIGVYATNSDILIKANYNASVHTCYITLQYTKTTDTAGSATTTPGAYDINFPNTWPENTEIFFGNGVYGYRKTGTITAAKNAPDNTVIMTGLQNGSIINWGCNWIDADGNQMGAGCYRGDTVQSLVQLNKTHLNGQLFFSTNDNTGARTNAPYDVWVTYSR